MKSAVEIKIIPAVAEDKELVFRFLQKYFYPDEPMNASLNRSPESSEEVSVLSSFSNALSFKAVDQSENLLGIVINAVRTPSVEEHLQDKLKKSKNPVPYAKILKALEIVNNGSDFWNRANVDKAFHTVCLATNTEYRGLNIGKKLLERSLDLSKSLNFEYATIECSSFYSAKIAVDFGYESYSELLFKDYLDDKNDIIFNVKPPHIGIWFYVKKLK